MIPMNGCAYDWCDVDHAEDEAGAPEHHAETLELHGIQVKFSFSEGRPNAHWSPDFSYWDFSPEEADDLMRIAEAFQFMHQEYVKFLSRLGVVSGRNTLRAIS